LDFFAATSETITDKALRALGSNLPQLDGKIDCELTKLDKVILNPFIETVVKVVVKVAGKSEETVRPVVNFLLKPFGKMIKSSRAGRKPNYYMENPEFTM